jgi:hypothetical protein
MPTVENKVHAGRAYIFDSSGNHVKTLQSPEPQIKGFFGLPLSVDEDFIVLHEEKKIDGYGEAGKVYVYDSSGDFVLSLQSPDPSLEGFFGCSAAIYKGLLVVGELRADGEFEDEGCVYVFDLDGKILSTLHSPEPVEGGFFGLYVSVFEDMLVVVEDSSGKIFFFEEGAAFELSNLVIDPLSVKEGESVTISCDVVNIGTLSGLYTVTLKIDGGVKEEKTVSLDVEGSETVSFEVSCESVGEFIVDVNGETGSYEVTRAQTGIPGFPFGSVILGLMISATALMILRRTRLM